MPGTVSRKGLIIPFVMDEGDFDETRERLGCSEDELIEMLVDEGWTVGKEYDRNAARYPWGNLYWPPEK